jgi:solute:Na+ symporter, SSS family
MNAWDLLPLFFFVAALILIGVWKGRRVASEGTYLVADRRIGLFALTATLVMTEINTATLISFAAAGYGVGGWALSLPLIFLVGLGFYAAVAAKKWHSFKGISVASFFTNRYGKDVGLLVSIALLSAMAGFSAAYVKSLYLLFLPIFPSMNEWSLTALQVGLVLAMTIRGGLLSVIYSEDH